MNMQIGEIDDDEDGDGISDEEEGSDKAEAPRIAQTDQTNQISSRDPIIINR